MTTIVETTHPHLDRIVDVQRLVRIEGGRVGLVTQVPTYTSLEFGKHYLTFFLLGFCSGSSLASGFSSSVTDRLSASMPSGIPVGANCTK